MIPAENLCWFSVNGRASYVALPYEAMAEMTRGAADDVWADIPRVYHKEGEDAVIVLASVRLASIDHITQAVYDTDDEAMEYAAGIRKGREKFPDLFAALKDTP